jgi:hypothetical protein
MARPLRILETAEVPAHAVRHFRISLAGPCLALVFVGVWVVACAAVAYTGGVGKVKVPVALAGWAAFWIGIYWLYVFYDLRKALSPAAWLAALGPDGIYVNLRSYRNIGRIGSPRHVVLVPYSAVASARATRDPLDPSAEARPVLLLKLVGAETSALELALAAERDGSAAGTPLGRMSWTPSPVALEAGETLAIEWRAHPGREVMLFELSRRGVLVEQRRPGLHALPR